MCCGNKALTVFAYHVLSDVSGARDVNNIRCAQMRLLPLLLMEGIRNWLNLFLRHCGVEAIWEVSGYFHTHATLCFAFLNFSSSILMDSILLSSSPHICVSIFPLPCCPLIFLTLFHPHCHPACHQWPSSSSPCLPFFRLPS